MKKIKLHEISCTRSGDKGPNSNVGIVFYNKEVYNWAVENLTAALIKSHFKSIVKGNVIRYELPNLCALNFILEDSLGGGGSDAPPYSYTVIHLGDGEGMTSYDDFLLNHPSG